MPRTGECDGKGQMGGVGEDWIGVGDDEKELSF